MFKFETFFHDVTSPYFWLLIVAISARGVYSCITKKDYIHAAAFIFLFFISAYFAGEGFGVLAPDFLDNILLIK